jgi:hypothetical protein
MTEQGQAEFRERHCVVGCSTNLLTTSCTKRRTATSAVHNKTDLLQGLGRANLHTFIEKEASGEDEKTRFLIPAAALHGNHGKKLRHLNWYEHCALVEVHKQHRCTGTSRPKGNAKAKSENMDDDDLKKDILANINGHPPP